MPPVSIAVIGAGLIGPRHAQTVIEDPNAKLAAIVDLTPRGAELAQKLNVPYYTSIGDLVESGNGIPEAAIVSTPNHTHVSVCLELIDAGVRHILVEKPISTDTAGGTVLLDRAREAGVKLLVGHHRRFNSYIIAAKKVIDAGELGDIVAINGLWTTYKPPEYFEPPGDWRRDKDGGVILINMIHEIDLLRDLVGPITRVYAEKMPSRRGFEAEEGAAITFRFRSGAVGSFLLSDHVPSPHNFEAGTGENPGIPRIGKDFYRIFGTEGMLSVPDMTVWRYEEGKKSWSDEMSTGVVPVVVEVPFRAQLRHFIQVVRGEAEPKCRGEDGMAALAVCEALRRSLESEMPVSVEQD